MKASRTLSEIHAEVVRQSAAKRDLLLSTAIGMRLIDLSTAQRAIGEILDEEAKGTQPKGRDRLRIEILPNGGAHLERLAIKDTAHRQIADWIGIPWKYYDRLCSDHADLVVHQVNALFIRESGMRMLRLLDGAVRAFVSDRYRRLDNDAILAATLPAILKPAVGGVPENRVIRSHIDDDSMSLTTVFTGDELKQVIGKARDGSDDVVRPGFTISNSETGKGRFHVRGFFYRSFCTNGAVFAFEGVDIELTRNHIGGKLAAGAAGDIISDEAKRADDAALMLVARDVMKAMGTVEMSQRLGDALRAAKNSKVIENVPAATSVLANELGLNEGESAAFLTNLIAESDLSRYGALNAVTAIANSEATSQDRAFELEALGNDILQMSNDRWLRIATAKVPVAVAA